jgi:uncharacterized membrane protein
MKKKLAAGMSTVLALVIASLITYYVLLYPNRLHTSIADIIDYLDDFNITSHLLALGLLSIYIGLIMFSATLIGILSSQGLRRAFTSPQEIKPSPKS